MSVLPVGFGGASGSYSITNSIRLNGTSGYLSKTLTTSATTSGSVWVKRSKLGATSPIFDNKVYFTSGDALYAFGLTSTALYRDPSAWMHIFWNGTGVYVNGTLVTGTGSYTAASVTNPRLGYDGTNYFSGYLSDFAFWNGSSASLQGGATNTDGVWAAKRPSAGYSFLAFGSSGALGTDTSGNGNNWTVNGSPAQTTDTPTNNYCTLNPIDIQTGGSLALNDGNLRASANTAATTNRIAGTIPITIPTYFEAKKTSSRTSDNSMNWGVKTTSSPFESTSLGSGIAGATEWLMTDGYLSNTLAINNGGSVSLGLGIVAQNDIVMVAVDPVNGKIWFGKNGTWYGSPSAGTGAAYSNIPSSVLPLFYSYNSTYLQESVFNFGATAFAYTPPTGFLPLCTGNLTSTAVTTSGTFTGNANANGPFVWTNGNPATLTINGNAVTFGTHADKTAGGFKLRSSSASYNTSGSNTWTATAGKRFVYSATSINTAQGNP
jgi:hypothetical protein